MNIIDINTYQVTLFDQNCNLNTRKLDSGKNNHNEDNNGNKNLQNWGLSIIISLVPLIIFPFKFALQDDGNFLAYFFNDIALIVVVFSFIANCVLTWSKCRVTRVFLEIFCLVTIIFYTGFAFDGMRQDIISDWTIGANVTFLIVGLILCGFHIYKNRRMENETTNKTTR